MKVNCFLLAIVLLSSCYAKTPQQTGHEGETMPSFNVLLTDSITYLNSKRMDDGKATILFLFGAYCPYSVEQIQEILEDQEKLKDINILAFNNTSFADTKTFFNQFDLSKYPNIKVGFDYSNYFSDYFEAPGYPYIAIYGKDKKLKKAFVGKVYSNQIKSAAKE